MRNDNLLHGTIGPALVLIAFMVVCLAPLACHKNYTLSPQPLFTATTTPTSTLTPVCGFIDLASLTNPTATPTPSTTVGPTPNSTFVMVPLSTFVISNPTPTYTHSLFGGFVLRSLADWQSMYGTGSLPPAGIDFSTQMILINTFPACCSGSTSITNVCETSTEIDLTLYIAPRLLCYTVCTGSQSIAIPKSDLPIYITGIMNGASPFGY